MTAAADSLFHASLKADWTSPILAHASPSILPTLTPAVAWVSDVPTLVTALIQNHPNWFLTILGLFTIGTTIAVIEGLAAAFPDPEADGQFVERGDP